ncbi:DUF1080 domain-containing protein [Aureibaculum sp. A20]|uniref:DUF1080 domain-containing protein n=1 Tax=Aureibaculum flavum TaxID=2795986 RepID=A0ABS0WVM2_9FLAO|nr:DUF1080 domain-containing protein [Aureibaculum flavum]MBJ2175956.1 DUF1080 domain-containing protein [Aureibaculum flavum]
MKSKLSYYPVLVTLIFMLTIACTKTQKDPLSDEGFVEIFNGKNWDGWHLKLKNGDEDMAKKVYAIEDGMVHVFKYMPDSLNLNTGENATHGLFYTNKKYSKYILRFEYKWGTKITNNFDKWQYDAGCYYHVFDDKIWPKGIEYQIRYNHITNRNHTGDFWAASTTLHWTATEDGKTFLLPNDGGKDMGEKKNELYGIANPTYNALNDKWNQCEIIVMGDTYTIHKLNGEIVNMATNLSVSEGVIGFQSETAEIYYRNIKIKEFEKVIPMTAFVK